MKHLKWIRLWFLLPTAFVSNMAMAGWSCPSGGGSDQITGIGYNNKYYQPRIKFQSQAKGDWSYLGYYQGINTDYGKALLAVALTAYSTGAKVVVSCDNTDVYGLWISDDGSTSPD